MKFAATNLLLIHKAALLEEVENKVASTSDSLSLELSSIENMTNSYSSNLQFIEGLLHYSKPEELIDLQTVISARLDSVNCVSHHFHFTVNLFTISY